MTTISDGTTTITIADGLAWTDEFMWAPVEQSDQRTITGALVVQTAVRIAGRPITLAPDDEGSGWMTRAALDQCKVWAAVPGQLLTVTYRSVARTVLWRHQDGAIAASPVQFTNEVDATDFYRATLRFLET